MILSTTILTAAILASIYLLRLNRHRFSRADKFDDNYNEGVEEV